MPQKTDSIAVAASGNSANVLKDTRINTVPADMNYPAVRLLCAGSALGLQAEMYAGQTNLLERSILNANNRVPIEPDDQVLDWVYVRPGEALSLVFFNTTAGSLTAFWKVELQDMPPDEG